MDVRGAEIRGAELIVASPCGLEPRHDQNQNDILRAHFGASLGPGSGSALPSSDPLSAAVPEPATLILMILVAAGLVSTATLGA